MQDGHSPSEYQRIKAEFEKIKRQRKLDDAAAAKAGQVQQQERKRTVQPSPVTKQAEARFTVTQGLLIVFFTLILWVVSCSFRMCCGGQALK
jgi:hypothetical protein